MPEASMDRSLGTFGNKMKPLPTALLASISGWLVALVIYVLFALLDRPLGSVPISSIFYGIGWIAAAAFLVMSPGFLAVFVLCWLLPLDNPLWHRRVGVPVGAFAGLIIMYIWWLAFARPKSILPPIHEEGTWLLAGLSSISAAIVVFVAITLRKHKAERAGAANPCAFGTSGISPAEQARMPEASRDT